MKALMICWKKKGFIQTEQPQLEGLICIQQKNGDIEYMEIKTKNIGFY